MLTGFALVALFEGARLIGSYNADKKEYKADSQEVEAAKTRNLLNETLWVDEPHECLE